MNSLTSCYNRDCTRSRQRSVDEQGVQERLPRVVRSDVHRAPPRKNPAPCLILPKPRKPIRRERGVPGRVLNICVTKIRLQRASVVPRIR
jgi:hypothetical protein